MKTNYMARLSRAARWMLPRAEAEDVISDYRDIVGTPPRPDGELVRDLGKPVRAVKLLAQPKAYRTWLAVFAILSACVLLSSAIPLTSVFRFFWRYDLSPSWLWAVGLPLGSVLSLVWFRRHGAKGPRLSRRILPPLILLLAGIAAVWWLFWQISIFPNGVITQDPQLELVFFGSVSLPAPSAGQAIHTALVCSSAAAAVIGVTGLVQARMGDRRWIALYILSLTLAALGASILKLLTNMTLEDPFFFGDWLAYYRLRCLAITAAGLIGTGAALC